MSRFRVCATGFSVIVLHASAAHAQSGPPPAASAQLAAAHYNTGVAEYRAGHFREAAGEFQSAYDLSHNAALLFNLGSAYYDAGDLPRARDAFVRYLAETPDAPNRPLVEARVESIRQRIGTPATDAIAASSAPPTDVHTDASSTAALPMVSSAPPVETPRPTVAVSHPLRIPGIVIAAAGAVMLGVGAGLWASVDSTYQQCGTNGGCADAMQPRALDAAAVGLFWGGAVVLVGGAILAIVAPAASSSRAASSRGSSLRFGFDPRGQFSVGGSF